MARRWSTSKATTRLASSRAFRKKRLQTQPALKPEEEIANAPLRWVGRHLNASKQAVVFDVAASGDPGCKVDQVRVAAVMPIAALQRPHALDLQRPSSGILQRAEELSGGQIECINMAIAKVADQQR